MNLLFDYWRYLRSASPKELLVLLAAEVSLVLAFLFLIVPAINAIFPLPRPPIIQNPTGRLYR